MTPEDSLRVDHASRRIAAFAALRQIRQLVDQELATEQLKTVWARRLGAVAGLALILSVTWALFLTLR